MKINEVMNAEILENLIQQGFISRKTHSEYPELAVLNYTPMAQYDSKLVWGDEMNNSRGFIYNTVTGDIVARPFKKFWNLNDERHPETMEVNLPQDIPLVTNKLDGSMGVVFCYDGKIHVATRGSFHSNQAQWATNWLRQNFPSLKLPEDATLITEIIYSENRIVVSYDWEGLVVLGIVRYDGYEYNRLDTEYWANINGLRVVDKFDKSLAECSAENITNQEGYVLTYQNGLKVKVKFDEYVRLHKILTGLNPKAIWELLSSGQNETVNAWLVDPLMPVDFKTWLARWIVQLQNDYVVIEKSALEIFADRPLTDQRKMMALYFTESKNKVYASLCFSLLDKDDDGLSSKIWKMIKPGAADTFKIDGE